LVELIGILVENEQVKILIKSARFLVKSIRILIEITRSSRFNQNSGLFIFYPEFQLIQPNIFLRVRILNFFKVKNFNFPENFAKFLDFSLIFLTVFMFPIFLRFFTNSNFITTLIFLLVCDAVEKDDEVMACARLEKFFSYKK